MEGNKRVTAMKKEKDDTEIPTELKRVLEELELEEESPDEEQIQVLEDIWLKAGEIGMKKSIMIMHDRILHYNIFFILQHENIHYMRFFK